MGETDQPCWDLRSLHDSSGETLRGKIEESERATRIDDRPRFASWQLFLAGFAAGTGLLELAKRWKHLRADEIEAAWLERIRREIREQNGEIDRQSPEAWRSTP